MIFYTLFSSVVIDGFNKTDLVLWRASADNINLKVHDVIGHDHC